LIQQILQWVLWLVTNIDATDTSKSLQNSKFDVFTYIFISMILLAFVALAYFLRKSLKEQSQEEERMRQHGIATLSDTGRAARMFL
jgi:cytochrome bd-type quinol oxidase subunit 1